MKTLVVPTNRPERLPDFFRAWRNCGGWDQVIIVHDAPTVPNWWSVGWPHGSNPDRVFDSMFDMSKGMRVSEYAWEDIERVLGDRSWVISRQDSAIRCFGFWMAWKQGATSILTLDDDCYPYVEPGNRWQQFSLHDTHLSQMKQHTAWVRSVPGQRTRGIPYTNLGSLESKVNVGLWTKVGDWDSVQDDIPSGHFQPPLGNRIIPAGQLTPMCGMNLCFKAEATPLMYFPLQGKGWPYQRFDDIWAGIIAKTLMDRLGWLMSAGEPFVEHTRASDPDVNRVKEAPGIEANEWFWQEVQEASTWLGDTHGTSVDQLMSLLGNALRRTSKRPYMQKVGEALQVWASLFMR